MVPVATKFPLSLTAKAEYVNPKLENKKWIRYYWPTQRGESDGITKLVRRAMPTVHRYLGMKKEKKQHHLF
jgi:hypothetical protein